MRLGDPERTGFRRHLRADQAEAERRLWGRLRNRRLAGFKSARQESVGPYVADFLCRSEKLIVEADGSQHAESSRDEARDAWLAARGYRILRFWNPEIMNNIDGVIETILAALPPSPRGRGEDAGPLVGAGVSPKGEGEGVASERADSVSPHPAAPPHPRSARPVPGKGDEALSPPAGRGNAHQ
ncbi:endonuclease domain-containing protein [Methylobacterium iners]|uniref:DUF559 domain-containing protein n=1 Tax=Methylobacterium iners TaxID=418707 RepID=A0ABQ4RW52_9HYPH|nr:DUF559 domain-containing protein [Methylobacterium iners]GJD93735.1 hypothetical protein OCOJLMKI_0931 [Methylobacterium iners]